jgi:retron-type reverse transcriptase
MKKQAYKPQPAKRVYIAKPGTDKKRPLGIPAYEDKLAVVYKLTTNRYAIPVK